jgi:hypothetical protein
MISPLVTTTALLLVPWQVTPTALKIHAPSKLPLPPPGPVSGQANAPGDCA